MGDSSEGKIIMPLDPSFCFLVQLRPQCHHMKFSNKARKSISCGCRNVPRPLLLNVEH